MYSSHLKLNIYLIIFKVQKFDNTHKVEKNSYNRILTTYLKKSRNWLHSLISDRWSNRNSSMEISRGRSTYNVHANPFSSWELQKSSIRILRERSSEFWEASECENVRRDVVIYIQNRRGTIARHI